MPAKDVAEPRDGYQERLAELETRVQAARREPDADVERAVGLLAGRVGCPLDDARAYLLQTAAEQARKPAELAIEVVAGLQARVSDTRSIRAEVRQALRRSRQKEARQSPAPVATPGDGWVRGVQHLLDVIGGRHMLVVPTHPDTDGAPGFQVAAASPAVTDLSGRRASEIIGRTLRELYPTLDDGPTYRLLTEALTEGQTREAGPFPYRGGDPQNATPVLLSICLRPMGPGVLATWRRHDQENHLEERLHHTERLGNLGWGEWDLVTGTETWSDGLFAIYERDPADGPLPQQESYRLNLPEDAPVIQQATEAFGRGETVDVVFRARIGGRLKYLRMVADAVRDLEGRPLKVYGIIQDVTARETSREKLAEVQRQLREHQANLAAEHKLAAQLQQIVLPIPEAPIDLPGLKVAVRYLPAERASRVGGDWYHAATASDGSVVLAVGDVAGHGVRAAATMAQLRHALAALLVTTTTEPAQLLSHLNKLLYEGGVWGATATMVLACYKPCSRTLEWAQAGHPAPLRSRAGVTEPLDRPDGPLLGAVRDPAYATARTLLDPGDVLVLYTDGLIEQRQRRLAEGLAPVVETLDRITAAPGSHPLADLLAELDRPNAEDDTCILAARPVAPVDTRGSA